MTLDDFRKGLSRRGLGVGARWIRADFHVHLPTSHDYQYKGSDAYERLGQALEEAKLSYAVVLKHETFATKAELETLQKHCPSVTLIPGSEINVIVDALFKKIGKDYFCHCIVAANPEQSDEYGYALRSAMEKFQYRDGEYPSGFRSSMLDLGKHFQQQGCLFIAAHLHQRSSPETSRSVDVLYDDETFLGFVKERAFSALEVTQLSTAAFFDGSHVTDDGISIPRITCVRSSDAHDPSHIAERKRFSWVQVENTTFGELEAALALPHRVSLSEPDPKHPRVVGMHIVGSFLEDVWVHCNSALNAFIGSKGSGKTALLECLRFVLNTPVPQDRAEQVQRHLQHILGSSGYVECLVEDEAGAQRLFTRRADSPDRIISFNEANESILLPTNAGAVFPISILGWHEIESVADQASARIKILDRVGDPVKVSTSYESISREIAKAREQLPILQQQLRRLDDSLVELWALQRKRATLTRLQQGNLSHLQEQYELFLSIEQRLQALEVAATARQERLPDIIPSRLESHLDVDDGATAEVREVLESVTLALGDIDETEKDTEARLGDSFERLAQRLSSAREVLSGEFAKFRDEVYSPQVNALPKEEKDILTKQIQVLEETKRLPTVESQCRDQLRTVHSLASELRTACHAVCTYRNEVAEYRESLVATLNDELTGVRLNFKRSANHEAKQKYQGTYGVDAGIMIALLDSYPGAHAYEKLRSMFDQIMELELDQDRWKVQRTLFDARLVALLDVIDDDDVDLFLSVGTRGWVPIQSLSAGQRCVTVFPLLLRNRRGPLVIDQPEDNLDNRYIADMISPELLTKKAEQQYVVTSHNANLVVLTDAELIVHVDSDGSKANFPAAGFLACPSSEVQKSVLDVLDGGEEALRYRQTKYGI